MEGLKLCYKKKASHPYQIQEHPFHLFTIEELCYYLYSNLCMLDKSIMNEKLNTWLEKELLLPDLAKELKELQSFEDQVEKILSYADYCSKDEWEKLHFVLDELKSQNQEERIRMRADHFFKNKKYRAAIYEYKKILEIFKENAQEQILNNIGVAYTKLFLFEEAAEYFYQAYLSSKKDAILKNYLFSCYFIYSEQDFFNKVKEFEVNDTVYSEIKNEIENAVQKIDKSVWMREIALALNLKQEGDLAAYYRALEKIIINWKQNYIQETT